MASGEILQEYLVSLGFKVDESSLKKWGTAIGGATGNVLKFAGVVTAAAAATFAFANSVSKQMEDLYWATQRIKSSANNVQSFELAIKKMGGTAEEARASLEGLARGIRTNPATEAFLSTLGVQTREANGDMRDMTLVMRDLGGQFQKMPYWLAAKWADTLGIDEGTLWKLTHGLDQFGDAYGELYRQMGVDPEKAAKASKDFQNQLQDLYAVFDVMEVKVGTILLPYMRSFSGWLIDLFTHTGELTDGTSTLSKALENIGVAIGDLSQIFKLIGLVAQAATWLIAKMPSEAIEFGIIGYFLFGKKGAFILSLLGAVSHFLDKISGDQGNVRPEHVKSAGEDDKYATNRWLADNGLGYLNSNDFNATYEEYKRRKTQGGDKTFLAKPDPNFADVPSSDYQRRPTDAGQDATQPATKDHDALGVRQNNPTNLRSWGNNPVSNGFARFANAQDGISAAAGNLMKYGQRGWDTVNAIISHWAPASDGNNTSAYVADISNRLRVGANQHLDLNNPGVLQNIIKGIISHENGYNPYSDKQISAGVNARLAMVGNGGSPSRSKPGNVTINQHNEFKISGGSDSKTIGKTIFDELGRVNGDLVRDAKSAVF